MPALPYVLLLFGVSSANLRPVAVKPTTVAAVTACGAVQKADIELALGRSLPPAEESVSGAESTCDYSSPKGVVSITLRRFAGRIDWAAEKASLTAAIPQGKMRDTKTPNALSFVMEIPGAGAQLHVIRDSSDYLLVSVLGFAEAPEAAAIAEKIARVALAGM